MKYSNKWFTTLSFSLIIACFSFSSQIYAQSDKNEAKIKSLKDKIAAAEAKVAAAELKMSQADSLITNGSESATEAEEAFTEIGEEQKVLDKEYKENLKELNKLLKSKDEETAKKAEADLNALDIKYQGDNKAIQARIKVLTKQAASGNANVEKGKEAQKTASVKLKDAQKALELAQENYDTYTNTSESE